MGLVDSHTMHGSRVEDSVGMVLSTELPTDYQHNSNNINNFITLRSHECGINEEYTDM